jgi:hypothetical protein
MKPIIGPGGKLRGYILETSTGKTLLAPGGKVLGYYNENTDQSLRPGGGFHSYGDTLMDLLED